MDLQSMRLATEAVAAAVASEVQAKSPENEPVCVDRRIVEVLELAKNLSRCICSEDLSLKNINNETHFGYN